MRLQAQNAPQAERQDADRIRRQRQPPPGGPSDTCNAPSTEAHDDLHDRARSLHKGLAVSARNCRRPGGGRRGRGRSRVQVGYPGFGLDDLFNSDGWHAAEHLLVSAIAVLCKNNNLILHGEVKVCRRSYLEDLLLIDTRSSMSRPLTMNFAWCTRFPGYEEHLVLEERVPALSTHVGLRSVGNGQRGIVFPRERLSERVARTSGHRRGGGGLAHGDP